MTAQLTQLTVGAQYTLQFYWAIRAAGSVSDTTAGNATESLYSVSYAGVTLYTSPQNLADAGGWALISVPFTASAASGNLIFNVTSLSNEDHTLLFDAVIVRSVAGPPTAYVQSSTAYGFEYPNLSVGSQVQYYYNPQQVAGFQPWQWYTPAGSFQSQGGIAALGSPFDPPAPSAPPQGTQYGFVQVTPLAGGQLSSWMSANVSGLTSGSNYYVSFAWAIRVQTVSTDDTPGNVTSASFTVTLGATTIYSSPKNLSDAGGWALVNSNTFSAPNGIAALGRTHQLVNGTVAWRGGRRIWQNAAVATLTVRVLGEAFIAAYLEAEGAALLATVGAYRMEGPGIQLFTAIDGEHSTILGLPMLPLLGFLRQQGVLTA